MIFGLLDLLIFLLLNVYIRVFLFSLVLFSAEKSPQCFFSHSLDFFSFHHPEKLVF